MFLVPQSSDSFNGSTREMNLFHHTQMNEAETVIWNRVFSSSMVNEARANVAGWNWKDLENNPEGPWGLPSTYIQRVDSSGTIGTIQPDNHLDFGIGAPGTLRPEDHRREEHADEGPQEPHAEDGWRDHPHDVRRHGAMVGAAVLLLQQHVGLPERCAVSGERDVRSAHGSADRLQKGHPPNAVRALRPGQLHDEAEPHADVRPAVGILRLDLRKERQSELCRSWPRCECADRHVAPARRHAVRSQRGAISDRRLAPPGARTGSTARWSCAADSASGTTASTRPSH